MVTNMAEVIQKIEQKYFKKNLPSFHVGDTVKMIIKVQEAEKTRLHPFEGMVIRKTAKGLKGCFTVRKISFGEGVERVFPLHSPVIESLKVVSKGRIKRAKLYYLRENQTKKTRVEKEQGSAAPVNRVG